MLKIAVDVIVCGLLLIISIDYLLLLHLVTELRHLGSCIILMVSINTTLSVLLIICVRLSAVQSRMGVETGSKVVPCALRYLVLCDVWQDHHVVVLAVAFVASSVSEVVVD